MEEDYDYEVTEEFKRLTSWDYRKMGVYILTNFDTTIEQDLERIYILRDLGYSPYVMIYINRSCRRDMYYGVCRDGRTQGQLFIK